MYQVSQAYLTALSQPVRKYKIRISIGNKVVDENNIRKGTFFVTNQCSDETQLQIGQVYVGELGVTLFDTGIGRYEWNKKEMLPYFGLVLADDSVEYIPLGRFIVSKAEWSADGVKITAYDYMQKFDSSCTLTIKKTSLYKLASLACSVCGVELGTTESEFRQLPNGLEEINTYDENDISTWRDVLYWVAQTSATFATIGRDGKLYFRKFLQNVVERVDDTGRYVGATFSDFKTRYTGISVVDQKAKYTRYYGMPTDDALTYNLGSNPFLQFDVAADRERCCRAILTAMQQINYVPFSVTAKCNPALDLGDIIRFEDGLADNNAISCVTKYTLNFHGAYEMSGSGEDPRLANGLSKTDKNLEGLMSQTEYAESLTRSTERRYYDYVNDTIITATDGGSRQKFADIDYKAGQGARLEFRAEVKVTCTQSESINGDDAYVESDAVVRVYYRDLGTWRTDYYPVDVLPGGTSLLHLIYVWTAPANSSDDRNFEAFVEMTGGSASVAVGDARSYVTTSGELEKPNPVISIEVDTMPDKTEYALGETLDFAGLVIAAVHEDGTRVDVTSQCTYQPAQYSQTTQEGVLTVNVTYTNPDGTFTTNFGLDVGAFALESIEVTQMPDKQLYRNGETLDYRGIIVIANYTNGTTKDVTAQCVFNPANGSTVSIEGEEEDTLTVEVSYTENDKTETTDFDLEVILLDSIEVTTEPTKTTYQINETLDFTGLVITASYSDGTSRVVTNQCSYSPANGTTVTSDDEIEVIVNYTEDGITQSTDFVLNYDPVVGIMIVEMPEYKYYVDENTNATLDYTGIEVVAVTENEKTKIVTDDCEIAPADGTVYTWREAGKYNAQVTYTCRDGEFTADFAYKIIIDYGTATIVDGYDFQNAVSGAFSIDQIVSIQRSDTPEPQPKRLIIKKKPRQLDYIVDQVLDVDGIEVWAEFDTHKSFNCTSQCTFTPPDGSQFTTAGKKVITVSYSYNTPVTTTFTVNVEDI